MPTDWKQQCNKSPYRWHEDGSIESQEKGFVRYDKDFNKNLIKTFYTKHGSTVNRYATQHNIPVPWVVAIVILESGGKEYACAPCLKTLDDGSQFCSFAPNCGGGVAADGKNYSCCAYGLMQVTNSNAVAHGMKHGAELLGNADDAIRIGIKIYKNCLNRHKGDPLIAVRQYNGCATSTCKDGEIKKCSNANSKCLFGIGGQSQGGVSYAEIFAKYVNTFIDMEKSLPPPVEPPPVEPPSPPVEPVEPTIPTEPIIYEASEAGPSGLLSLALAIGIGIGTYWYMGKRNF